MGSAGNALAVDRIKLPDSDAVLIGVGAMAELLQVSDRPVWRLASSGEVPRPVEIGRSRRWVRATVMSWIDQGCPKQPQ